MTKERFKQIKNQISTQYTTLEEIINDFNLKELFCIGANSSYFFYGNIIDLYKDINALDKFYQERYNEFTSIMKAQVIDVRVKHSYEPHIITAFIIDGNRPGRCWFSCEYPNFIKNIRNVLKNSQTP